MEERISCASAYPWAEDERQIQISSGNKRKRKGSGFAVLEQALLDSTTSIRAKEILTDLLGNDTMEEASDDSRLLATMALTKQTSPPPSLETINPNAPLPDQQILSMAQDGRFSLLGSIVRVVRESIVTPVTVKQILKTCILAVQPGTLPADMDAKDMILAALLFLSSTHKSEYWKLPLIRPVQEDVDLEKLSYELVGSPTEAQLQWLDAAFSSSADKYLAREKYCPRLDKDDEGPLLLKGTIPAIAMPMTAAAKRKATLAAKAAAAAASPTPEAMMNTRG